MPSGDGSRWLGRVVSLEAILEVEEFNSEFDVKVDVPDRKSRQKMRDMKAVGNRFSRVKGF